MNFIAASFTNQKKDKKIINENEISSILENLL